MDFFEAVEQRYSYKQTFADVLIPWEHLEKIAQAGLKAPTGNNSQCVHLVILVDKADIEPVLDIAARGRIESASAAIALFTDSSEQSGGKNFEMEDYSAAAAQMLLAITALGYVSVWLDSPYFNEEAQKKICETLGVPDTYCMRVMLPIGIPSEEGSRREKKGFWERVSLGTFGKTGR